MKTLASAALALTLSLGLASGALAHAKLVKSDPPAGGEAKDKSNIELTFSEVISGKLSGAAVSVPSR